MVAETRLPRENYLADTNHSLTNFISMLYLMLYEVAVIIIKICISISLVIYHHHIYIVTKIKFNYFHIYHNFVNVIYDFTTAHVWKLKWTMRPLLRYCYIITLKKLLIWHCIALNVLYWTTKIKLLHLKREEKNPRRSDNVNFKKNLSETRWYLNRFNSSAQCMIPFVKFLFTKSMSKTKSDQG